MIESVEETRFVVGVITAGSESLNHTCLYNDHISDDVLPLVLMMK